jgi:hypothetical protein
VHLRRATRVAPVAGAQLATPWDRSRRAERENEGSLTWLAYFPLI